MSTDKIVNNPYLEIVPVTKHDPSRGSRSTLHDAFNQYVKKMDDATRKAEVLANNLWYHIKFSPSMTDAAIARLTQGTKALIIEGGRDKIFQQTFGSLPGEKLIKAHACYLSTSSGPVIGTLYVSTKRVTFCSDYPCCQNTYPGQSQRVHYKVIMQLEQLSSVNPSANKLNPSEKYIQVVTKDGHEFWFMGFISYDKALKHLSEALHHARESSREIPVNLVS
ncbi:hypothetical protein ACFE04_018048 [Oxalis oulophora]